VGRRKKEEGIGSPTIKRRVRRKEEVGKVFFLPKI
jgi:hypothetical protein